MATDAERLRPREQHLPFVMHPFIALAFFFALSIADPAYAQVAVTILHTSEHHGTIQPIERSEEHTSELQSRLHLVCRLLLEKKKKKNQKELIANYMIY